MLQIIMTCINVLLVFILLLVPGFFSAKKKYIVPSQVDGFSFFTTNFLWPAMIIDGTYFPCDDISGNEITARKEIGEIPLCYKSS